MNLKYFRHRNGNGRKTDNAKVFDDSLVSKNSFIEGDCDVIDTQVVDSVVRNSFVSHSKLLDGSTVQDSIVSLSYLQSSSVSAEFMVSSHAWRSVVNGQISLLRTKVIHSTLSNATISDAEFHNVVFNGQGGYVKGGVWTRPPRVLAFPDKVVTLVENANQTMCCNCFQKPLTDWIAKGRQYGRRFDLNDDEIRQGIEFAKSLRSI